MSYGDMFLKVDGTRSGGIKGEANDQIHRDEIDVVGWSWGMRSASAMSGAGTSAKTTVESLHVTKEVDAASTALMSVMRNNELLKKVVLSVRKSGGLPIDYLVVTLEQARITSYDVTTLSDANDILAERITFSFQKILVEYSAQDDRGIKKGSSSFTAEVN
ncbi:Hcp family type VI secretion system effector [Caldimonas brevitalea]|uniref:Type VI secretion system secreted protein Hcp n=1 Tax=Caldimonas brevitalea TaxID=413882 RepID=A0A0G3BLK7_9BURK|nr:type VI secretion system tube protein Hcp [Caldimonas brevitalea]AKJ28873.1 type VI secretion system secreted protein Hcp [Caldimonas brevitalea]